MHRASGPDRAGTWADLVWNSIPEEARPSMSTHGFASSTKYSNPSLFSDVLAREVALTASTLTGAVVGTTFTDQFWLKFQPWTVTSTSLTENPSCCCNASDRN